MADQPPNAGSGASRGVLEGHSLSEEEWQEALATGVFISGSSRPVAKFPSKEDENGSDDSFDVVEEYVKELEEQRIADEKNGHFASAIERDLLRPVLATPPAADSRFADTAMETEAPPSRVSLATHRKLAFMKHAASLDECMAEGSGENVILLAGCPVGAGPTVSLSESSREPLGLDEIDAAERERETLPPADVRCTIANKSEEFSAEKVMEMETSTFCHLGNEVHHAASCLSLPHVSNLHGNVGDGTPTPAENQPSPMDENYLLLQEANMLLDTLESRPLVDQNILEVADSGTPSLGPIPADLGHHFLQPGPEVPCGPLQAQSPLPSSQPSLPQPTPLLPQPAPKGPSHASIKKKQKAYFSKKSSALFKPKPPSSTHRKPLDPSKQPPAAFPPQPNAATSSSKPSPKNLPQLNAKEKDLLASLFVVKKPGQNVAQKVGETHNASEKLSSSVPICDEEMAEFPPLNASSAGVAARKGAAGVVAGTPSADTPESSAPTPPCNPDAAPPASVSTWADRVSFNANILEKSGAAVPPHPNQAAVPEPPAQPNVHADQSTANAIV